MRGLRRMLGIGAPQDVAASAEVRVLMVCMGSKPRTYERVNRVSIACQSTHADHDRLGPSRVAI